LEGNNVLYVPNVGEMAMLRQLLATMEIQLGLYKNQVVPDGNTVMNTLVELPTGGGRAYVPKTLKNEIVESALTADKWYLSLNSQGKAEGQYSDAAQSWIMNAADIADGNTIYGAFGYVWVLPFDHGLAAGPIKVGDTVTGAGGGQGVVTGVQLISGSWAGGDAAGYLFLKTKSGTFVNDEALSVSAVQMATANTGVENAGDAHKKIIFIDAFSSGYAIDTVGLTIEYTPKISASSASA
jgi:hypothetical protein